MDRVSTFSLNSISRDLAAGLVVFLVALPLCTGVALVSGAPLISGLIAGIVGGIIVGALSGSHTSVSGPAAGLTAIVATQITQLGSFDAFLLAVVVAGLIQVGLGLMRAGFVAAFFPSSVIKGLLAAIGVILILKQIPHVLGHDSDPEGEMAFLQPDHQNTFTELVTLFYGEFHDGALVIGILSVALLVIWDKWKPLRKSRIPAPLIVVVLGVVLAQIFSQVGGVWAIAASHLVQVPVADDFAGFLRILPTPNFALWNEPAIYSAGFTIAILASLESLLNLQAVDDLDPKQRISPANRELLAQGIGNVFAGLIGGLPMTSVVARSSVNLNTGSQSKLSTITHGVLLLVCVSFLPTYLNLIPLSCLAAILLVTGFKLVSPQVIMQHWNLGRYQFIPFMVTLIAIVMTDLLTGVLIGLAISIAFILNSNFRRPLRRVMEKHPGGDVLHIHLANQVSFLNRAILEKTLWAVPPGGHVLLDASATDYIDPDILSLIRDFKDKAAPAHGVQISLRGFRDRYQLEDQIQFVDSSTREFQNELTAAQVLQILQDGNERFRNGRQLTRDLSRQVLATAGGQHPWAVVLSCIDSRTPSELIFDLGLGDIFSVRVAGNIISPKVLGSMEYATAVAGAKLVLVVGHTRCGAVAASVNLACSLESVEQVTGCQNLEPIVLDIQKSIDLATCRRLTNESSEAKAAYADQVARLNVQRLVPEIIEQSQTIRRLTQTGRIAIVGAMYDVATGKIDFLVDQSIGLNSTV